MVSLSVGIASSYVSIYDASLYKRFISSGVIYITGISSPYRAISFPVELKAFYLARNGIGIGIHISENIVTNPKYSPFCACLSIVTGFWNKHKK
jgi:hypothetical protein